LLGDEIKGKFRLKAPAQALYAEILKESGYKPEAPKPATKDGSVERYLDDLEAYWDSSHKHGRRGGKGRY